MRSKINARRRNNDNETEVVESNLWNTHSGFNAFKRRIDLQIQLSGLDISLDDEDLLPFYRMGESETYVLGALNVV